ncbi:MAG: TPM domain-containing protein [Clostridia bacterium]|nr:TPM domain-containing protein [Clostridia bacterium]
MKKRIISIAIVFVMLFSFAFAASANSAHVIDFTDKLTDSEMIELDSYALTIEQKYGWCVMFAIVDNAENFDTTYEYAEDIYNAQKDAENGVLIVDNIGDNVYSVYLAGDAKNVFSEADEDAIWNAYDDADTYYGGIVDYYTAVDSVLGGDGISADPIITTAAADTEDTTAFERVERQLPLVVDLADLLTDAEESEFNEKFNAFTEEYEMEIAFLTVTSLDGKTAQQFADDFYDANGYGYGENDDGFLLLYLPGEDGQRELYLTTHGDAIYKMSDDMINTMLLEMKDDIISGNYIAALDTYIAKATEYVKPGVHFIWLFVFMLVGCVIALFVLNGMAAANKSVIRQADAKVYVRGGSLVLMNSNEVFKGTYVDKEEKVQENSNSGSSTHKSSSGRTHGGGGIKF